MVGLQNVTYSSKSGVNYYPFGMKHEGYNTQVNSSNTALKRRYNNKEYQDELGLNMTAMDYRQYDPAIGRFNSMDRLSELAQQLSPYRFAFNNPVFWSDPSGLFETRKEARAYRKKHDITGSIKKQEDGTFAIIDNENNISYHKGDDSEGYEHFSNDGVLETQIVSSTNKESSNTGSSNNSWWVIESLPVRNKNIDKPFNITLGSLGTIITPAEAWLHKERKLLENRNTLTSMKKINKFVKPSIDKIGKLTKGLGVASAIYSGGSLGYDIVSGQEVTAGQVFDTAITIGFSLIAISNPIGLIALGTYSVIDMYGGFDAIKEKAGMNTVIINK